MWFLGHTVSVCLQLYKKQLKYFPRSFYFPNSQGQKPQVLSALSSMWKWQRFLKFYFSHYNRCVGIPHDFSLHFPDDLRCWTSFCVLICHPDIFFSEVCSNLLSIKKKKIICFLMAEFFTFFIYSKHKFSVVIGCMIHKYFLSFSGLSFHSFNIAFCKVEVLKWRIICKFFILWIILLLSCLRTFCLIKDHDVFAEVFF